MSEKIWYVTGVVVLLLALIVLCFSNMSHHSHNTLRFDPIDVLLENHLVTMEILSNDPHIVLLHNFLKPDECDALIKLAEESGMDRSTVQGITNELSKDRTSYTTNFKRGHNDLIAKIERRAATFARLPLENLEPLQICRYKPGQQYKPHYDFFVPNTRGTDEALKKGGQRHVTLFVYLNDLPADETSGHTHFPKLDLKIAPRKGTAALWLNVKPDKTEDFRTLHAGTPPTSGTKYGMNIWFRERPFVQ